MRLAKITSQPRRRAKLRVCRLKLQLDPDQFRVVRELSKLTGMDPATVLGHALKHGTGHDLLAAVAAIHDAHYDRVQQVVTDLESCESLPLQNYDH